MDFAFYSRYYSRVAQYGIEETAKYAVSLGFTGVEVLCSADDQIKAIPDAAAGAEAKKVLDSYGLKTVCYSVGANFWNNPQTVQLLVDKLEIISALGCPYLHHTLLPGAASAYSDDDFDERIETAVNGAEAVAKRAAEYGITCIYEDQGFYVNGIKGFGAFFDEMKRRCTNVGVCMDVGNILFVNEWPEDFLRKYIADVKHVHIKDYLRKEIDTVPSKRWSIAKGRTKLRDTMIGDGVIDFAACMKILKENGYNGPYALELCHPEPFEDGVKQAMEYLSQF